MTTPCLCTFNNHISLQASLHFNHSLCFHILTFQRRTFPSVNFRCSQHLSSPLHSPLPPPLYSIISWPKLPSAPFPFPFFPLPLLLLTPHFLISSWSDLSLPSPQFTCRPLTCVLATPRVYLISIHSSLPPSCSLVSS